MNILMNTLLIFSLSGLSLAKEPSHPAQMDSVNELMQTWLKKIVAMFLLQKFILQIKPCLLKK